jgi:hypothetical protein
MRGPIRRRSMTLISLTTAARSTTFGSMTWRRLNASSWRVRLAARSAVDRISSALALASAPACASRAMSSAHPIMTMS